MTEYTTSEPTTDGIGPALDEAVAVLNAAESIVTIGHIGPDGDALGSALGLARAAALAGKNSRATFGEPFVVPDQLSFLRLDLLASPGGLTEVFDVAVAVDTASPDRLGSAMEIAQRAKTFIVIDHHISNDGFGDISIVDPHAAATGQVIHRLVDMLGWELDQQAAEALYVALVTDTGRFQYSNTSPEVHRVASQLLDKGVSPDDVGRHLYEESPFGFLGVAGAVMSRARLDTNLSLVWSVVTAKDLSDANVTYEQSEGLIDLIRVAREAEVACLLKDLGDGRTKGSLRSRGRIDVGAIAGGLGGGGHHNAAGFTHHGDVETVVDLVKEALR